MKKVLAHVVLPLAILTTGSLAVAGLLHLRAKETAPAGPPPPPLVETLAAVAERTTSTVSTTGVVGPAREVTVAPDVAGRVVAWSAGLVPGGRVQEGEVLARLDDQRYRLAQAQARSRLDQARLHLAQEQALRQVARDNWSRYGDDRPLTEVPVASRRLHLEAARSAIRAAEAGLEQAARDVAATVVRAPWNGMVVEAHGEVGQLAGPNRPLAHLVGTDRVWVLAALPVGRLHQLQVPGLNAEVGSAAQVISEQGEEEPIEREGHILRLSGQLDPATRNAQVVIAVDLPFDSPPKAVPLLPGSFVTVKLRGREEQVVFPVPQRALHQGRHLWLVNGDQKLEERPVTIGWRAEGLAYVTSGLGPGERVVVSPLAAPRSGRTVRPADSAAPGRPAP